MTALGQWRLWWHPSKPPTSRVLVVGKLFLLAAFLPAIHTQNSGLAAGPIPAQSQDQHWIQRAHRMLRAPSTSVSPQLQLC